MSRGFGLVAVLLMILGLSLSAGALFISAAWLRNDKATYHTKVKLGEIATVIAAGTTDAQFPRHYETDMGALPTTLNDLLTQPAAAAACAMNFTTRRLAGWCGPYYDATYSGENVFSDGWGRTILYDSAARTLRSVGPNGVDNAGAGDDIVHTF